MFRPYMAIIRFFFFLKVPLYKFRCGDLPSDYNSSMPMYRRVLYYINIYILFFLTSQFIKRNLKEKEIPDDGHIRPKHVVLIQILEYTSFI